MDPVTLGLGLGSLTAGLIGLGSSQDESARAQNRQWKYNSNLMTYQHQLGVSDWNRQSAWAEDMWNKQNAYNSPEQMVERYRNAGINPNAIYGNGSVIAAGGVQAPSQPSVGLGSVSPVDTGQFYSQAAHAVQGSVNSYYNNELLRSQASKNTVEAARTEALTPHEVTILQNQAKGSGFEADLAKTRLAYESAVLKTNIDLQMGNRDVQLQNLENLRLQQKNMELQNGLLQIQKEFEPQLKRGQLAQFDAAVTQLRASAGLLNANRLLTDEQRLTEIEHRADVIVNREMHGLDKEIKNATKQYVIDLFKEDLYSKEDSRMLRGLDAYQKHLGKAANYTITPGAAGVISDLEERNFKRDRFNPSRRHQNSNYRPHFNK